MKTKKINLKYWQSLQTERERDAYLDKYISGKSDKLCPNVRRFDYIRSKEVASYNDDIIK